MVEKNQSQQENSVEIIQDNPEIVLTEPNDVPQIQNIWQMPQDIIPLNSSQINRVDSVANEEIGSKWYRAMTKTNKILDGIIMSSFVFLLFSSTCFAVFTIIYKIITLGFLPSSNPPNSDKAVNLNTSNDTNILIISEYIFLSLLPIFIVFGFFNYYKHNSRIYLTGIGLDKSEDINSTKTMNLTKKLFMSSVISYVMIKIIEVVFKDGEIETSKIVASSFLLSILMIYSILFNKFHS